eukprot:3132341-Pyramimonas_sp.AAC.1
MGSWGSRGTPRPCKNRSVSVYWWTVLVLSLLYDLVYTPLLTMRPSTHDVCRFTCERISPFPVNKFGLNPRTNEDFR